MTQGVVDVAITLVRVLTINFLYDFSKTFIHAHSLTYFTGRPFVISQPLNMSQLAKLLDRIAFFFVAIPYRLIKTNLPYLP